MALIKCDECGKEHSEKAATCPNCGAPNSYLQRKEEVARQKNYKQEMENQQKKSIRRMLWRSVIATVFTIAVYIIYNAQPGLQLPWYFLFVNTSAVFIAIYIGDWIRKFTMPTIYTTKGWDDAIIKRIHWLVGPQIVTSIIATIAIIIWLMK